MKQKLIALDLDGTTLNRQGKVSQRTKETLSKVTQLGHRVILATGRSFQISKHIYKELGLNTPMVNFNSGLVHLPYEEWDKERVVGLDLDVVDDIIKRSENRPEVSLLTVESKDYFWVNKVANPDIDFFPRTVTEEDLLPTSYPQEIISVMLFSEDPDDLAKEIKTAYPNLSMHVWKGHIKGIEILSKKVHKADGVFYVADQFNISNDDIIAFGDEENDYEMLQSVGLGVAMANASSHLKEIAKDVTEFTNDEDGVARYLENYFKLN